jgi:hypothetical protein
MNGATIQEHPCAPGEPCLESPYPFTAAEIERLTIYRAAIHAGFYSDQSGPRRRGASASSSGHGACTLVDTEGTRRHVSFANMSMIDAQLSEWLAPERR